MSSSPSTSNRLPLSVPVHSKGPERCRRPVRGFVRAGHDRAAAASASPQWRRLASIRVAIREIRVSEASGSGEPERATCQDPRIGRVGRVLRAAVVASPHGNQRLYPFLFRHGGFRMTRSGSGVLSSFVTEPRAASTDFPTRDRFSRSDKISSARPISCTRRWPSLAFQRAIVSARAEHFLRCDTSR